MALDLREYNITEIEAAQLSQAVFEQVVTGGVIEQSHAVHEKVQIGRKIPIVGKTGLPGRKYNGCTPAEDSTPLSNKSWSPEIVGGRLSYCGADLEGVSGIMGKSGSLSAMLDKSGSNPVMSFLFQVVGQNALAAFNRYIWFGDKAAKTVANSGELKNGTDISAFNVFDGIFKQTFEGVAGSKTVRVSIPQNAKATKAEQMKLETNSGYNAYNGLVQEASPAVKQLLASGDLAIHTTGALFHNYTSSRVNMANNADASDKPVYSFGGIPIIPRYDWDSVIAAYFDNGTKYVNPHRAILTYKGNIPVGTLSKGSLSEVTSNYDVVGRKVLVDYGTSLDAKVLDTNDIVIAY